MKVSKMFTASFQIKRGCSLPATPLSEFFGTTTGSSVALNFTKCTNLCLSTKEKILYSCVVLNMDFQSLFTIFKPPCYEKCNKQQ